MELVKQSVLVVDLEKETSDYPTNWIISSFNLRRVQSFLDFWPRPIQKFKRFRRHVLWLFRLLEQVELQTLKSLWLQVTLTFVKLQKQSLQLEACPIRPVVRMDPSDSESLENMCTSLVHRIALVMKMWMQRNQNFSLIAPPYWQSCFTLTSKYFGRSSWTNFHV